MALFKCRGVFVMWLPVMGLRELIATTLITLISLSRQAQLAFGDRSRRVHEATGVYTSIHL